MFVTAISVALEEHLFEVVLIQRVDTFIAKDIFLAGRTMIRRLAIDLNAGYAKILTTCLVDILTRFQRDALAKVADILRINLLGR